MSITEIRVSKIGFLLQAGIQAIWKLAKVTSSELAIMF